MVRSLAALGTVVVSLASAQFSGLATPYDGSVVYFASTLRLKGTNEPNHGKLFAADETGVRLVSSRERVDVPPFSPPCTLGNLYAFTGAEVSADGRTILAAMQRTASGGCSYPPLTFGTGVISPGGERDLTGVARISPGGRYAIQFIPATGRPTASVQALLLDLQTGGQTPISLPQPAFPNYVRWLPDAGRVIADDGTAIVAYSEAAYVVRRGAEPQPFPVAGAHLLAIDASGAKVLYQTTALRIFDLRTQEDRLVLDQAGNATAISMSDDGGRIVFLRGGQAWTIDTDGTGLHALTDDRANITAAILSGSGKVAYAATGEGRLLKIHVDTGDLAQLIGRTPYLPPSSFASAGLIATLPATGISDVSLLATVPVGPRLANVSVSVSDRSVPVVQVTPASVSFIVPWDAAGPQVRVVVETAGVDSPFDSPETSLAVDTRARAGAIAHQNWDGPVNSGSPAHVGEIIHVWAIGLGAVNPEVPAGTVSPLAEPLARLASPMVCSNSNVLYAGLAPGYLERVYQVDLRIGNVTGYLRFQCSIGGGSEFIFLTLLVVP